MTKEEAEKFIDEIVTETGDIIHGYVNEYIDSTGEQMAEALADLKKEMIEKFILKYLEV